MTAGMASRGLSEEIVFCFADELFESKISGVVSLSYLFGDLSDLGNLDHGVESLSIER